MVRKQTAGAGDEDLIPGSERSPGGGHGNLLRSSCLENPTDRGAWGATAPELDTSEHSTANTAI